MNQNTVLLIVDMQTALVEGHPYKEQTIVSNIRQLIECARENQIEVIYVRHDGGAGDELEKHTQGWEIYHEIAPEEGDKIIDKSYNSAFRKTSLHTYLQEKQTHQIILAGMQTEYCIDTTCRVAFEYGYSVMIAKETTTTYDNEYATGEKLADYYENKIWNNRFAKVLPLEEVHDKMRTQVKARRFQETDAEEVRQLIVRNFLEVNSKDYGMKEMQLLAENYGVEKVLQIAGYAHMYVFESENKIVGVGSISSFWGSETESILLTIFVLPELHGNGIGRKIIQTLEQDEFFIRANRVEIPASVTATEFYRKFGYDYKNGVKELDNEYHYRLEKYKETGKANE